MHSYSAAHSLSLHVEMCIFYNIHICDIIAMDLPRHERVDVSALKSECKRGVLRVRIVE
jgi:hypothetical protein